MLSRHGWTGSGVRLFKKSLLTGTRLARCIQWSFYGSEAVLTIGN